MSMIAFTNFTAALLPPHLRYDCRNREASRKVDVAAQNISYAWQVFSSLPSFI